MSVAAIRSGLLEGRSLWSELGDESDDPVGSVVISGMLAEQLARELGAGAEPGAVVVREGVRVSGAEILVRVIAGAPVPEDDGLVRDADAAGVPVVLVQLWPQAEWTAPFVLTPFVVECQAGHGFPVDEIARRISESTERAPALAARIPALRDAVAKQETRGAVIRAGLRGLLGSGSGETRRSLALEQARSVSRLHASDPSTSGAVDARALAGAAAAVYASSYLFRAAARAGRERLPARLVDAAVAAVGTWAVTEAARRLEAQLDRSERP
jgi:hypothetical protein